MSGESVPMTMPPDAVLSQMLFGALMQKSIYVAAKLGIADLLSVKPQTVGELAAATETHEPSLYRVLRLLASAGIFSETADRLFELTPMAELLRADSPGSMRDAALLQGSLWDWGNISEMMYSVKTGKTAQSKIHGMELFEFLANNPENEKIFNSAMTSFSLALIPAIVEAYDFSQASVIADIGGGHGSLLANILKANPQARGILFDQPSVVKGAGDLFEKEAVESRVEIVSGSFFESVPQGADVYIMKYIIHDWTDEQSIKILKNIHHAMNDNGKVLLAEMVVPEGNAPSPAKVIDVQMLVTTGGRERTENEYRKLLDAAGFRLTRVIPTKSPMSVVEAVKI